VIANATEGRAALIQQPAEGGLIEKVVRQHRLATIKQRKHLTCMTALLIRVHLLEKALNQFLCPCGRMTPQVDENLVDRECRQRALVQFVISDGHVAVTHRPAPASAAPSRVTRCPRTTSA